MNYIKSFMFSKDSVRRNHNSKEFLDQFSCIEFSKRINDLLNHHPGKYSGLNSLATKYLEEFYNLQNKKIIPNQNNIPSENNLYYEIYKTYLNPNVSRPKKMAYQVQWLNDTVLNQNNIDFYPKDTFYYNYMPHSGAIYNKIPFIFNTIEHRGDQFVRAGSERLTKSNFKKTDYLAIELSSFFKNHKHFYYLKSKNKFIGNHSYLIILPGMDQDEIITQLTTYITKYKISEITLLKIITLKETTISYDFIEHFLNRLKIKFNLRSWKEAISEKLILNSAIIEINNYKLMSISYCTYYLMNLNVSKLSLLDESSIKCKFQATPLSPYIEMRTYEDFNE